MVELDTAELVFSFSLGWLGPVEVGSNGDPVDNVVNVVFNTELLVLNETVVNVGNVLFNSELLVLEDKDDIVDDAEDAIVDEVFNISVTSVEFIVI